MSQIQETNGGGAWVFNSHYHAHNFFWVSKTFRLNRGSLGNLIDIDIDAKLFNCIPSNCNMTPYSYHHNTINGIWYTKKKIDDSTWDFTIHVAWGAPGIQNTVRVSPPFNRYPIQSGNDWRGLYTGFAVINRDMELHTPRKVPRNGLGYINSLPAGTPTGNITWNADNPGAPGPIGISIYPSVKFNVIGIFSDNINGYGNNITLPNGSTLGQGNPTIINL